MVYYGLLWHLLWFIIVFPLTMTKNKKKYGWYGCRIIVLLLPPEMLFFDPKNHPKYSRGEGGTRDLGQLKFTWKTRSPIFCGHFESVSKKRSWISSDIYAMSIHFLGLPTSTKSFFFRVNMAPLTQLDAHHFWWDHQAVSFRRFKCYVASFMGGHIITVYWNIDIIC